MRAVKIIASLTIQNRVCRHILFWAVSFYYLLHFFLQSNEIGKIDYIYTLVFHLPLVAGVYANLVFGLPRLLGRKRYVLYAGFMLLLLAAMVVVNKTLFEYVIDYLAPGYFFISDLSWYELLQFSLVYIGLTSLIRLSGSWWALQESRSRLILVEKEKINAELSFLRGQVNPHFLFNSLNNIYSLVLKKDGQAPASLLKLSSVMRYMIYESNENLVPLKKEIEYVSNYIELQRLRVRDQSGILFETRGEVGDQMVAPLMFIVFIENAFKHGTGAGAAPDIDIRLETGKGRVRLRVENVKGLVDEVDPPQYRGLGIENVRRRLDLVYPGLYGLNIDDGPDRYTIELEIPLMEA